jgi:exonuclease VII large subunit
MLARRLALAIAMLAGLIGSQGPEFAQQYRQRIGGALDELKRMVAEFDAETASEHLTPAQGLSRLEANSDPLARERGEDMAETMDRARRLEEQLEAMAAAGPLKRLYVMVKDFDPQIARRTLDNYEPAAPLSLEALTAGGLAAAWGWAATHLCAWPFRRRSRLRARGSASA